MSERVGSTGAVSATERGRHDSLVHRRPLWDSLHAARADPECRDGHRPSFCLIDLGHTNAEAKGPTSDIRAYATEWARGFVELRCFYHTLVWIASRESAPRRRRVVLGHIFNCPCGAMVLAPPGQPPAEQRDVPPPPLGHGHESSSTPGLLPVLQGRRLPRRMPPHASL